MMSDLLFTGPGEIKEAIMGADMIPILGDVLAVQGLIGCTNVTCTRHDGRCISYHCPRCLRPTDSQGSPSHTCVGGRA